jgi:adenylylsulfate kinase
MPNYFEVYLDVPLEVLKQRDVKGIYENFQQNRLFNVVGGDIKFHIPKNLDLIINYHPDDTPESNAAKIFELIQERPTV